MRAVSETHIARQSNLFCHQRLHGTTSCNHSVLPFRGDTSPINRHAGLRTFVPPAPPQGHATLVAGSPPVTLYTLSFQHYVSCRKSLHLLSFCFPAGLPRTQVLRVKLNALGASTSRRALAPFTSIVFIVACGGRVQGPLHAFYTRRSRHLLSFISRRFQVRACGLRSAAVRPSVAHREGAAEGERIQRAFRARRLASCRVSYDPRARRAPAGLIS